MRLSSPREHFGHRATAFSRKRASSGVRLRVLANGVPGLLLQVAAQLASIGFHRRRGCSGPPATALELAFALRSIFLRAPPPLPSDAKRMISVRRKASRTRPGVEAAPRGCKTFLAGLGRVESACLPQPFLPHSDRSQQALTSATGPFMGCHYVGSVSLQEASHPCKGRACQA